MSNLAWKINRLMAMGPAEVGARIRTATRLRLVATGLWPTAMPEGAQGSSNVHRARAWLQAWPKDLDPTYYQERATAIDNGTIRIFRESFAIGSIPQWNLDPKSAKTLPLNFGPLMNLRDPSKIGSIKHLWELNRHASIVELAQAWVLNGDDRHLTTIHRWLSSWITQCPTYRGANWHSAMEVAFRLINWAIAWHLLGLNHPKSAAREVLGDQFIRNWDNSAFAHAQFIADNRSGGSSANNHLIGELAGLFVATQTWDAWPESSTWAKHAKRGLEAEVSKQIHKDGVGAEQAIWYLYEICDLVIFCVAIARANGILFNDACYNRLKKAQLYIDAMANCGGVVPRIGDSDDARPIVLGRPYAENPYRTISQLMDHWAGLPYDQSNHKLRWLAKAIKRESPATSTAIGGAQPYKRLQPNPYIPSEIHTPHCIKSLVFAEGGYLIASQNTPDDEEIKIVFDTGPLGYLSIAAHGHADALNLLASYGGWPVLVDPGTYSYKPNDPWRDWFRGTLAHNTVTIDSVNQSQIRGPFLWSHHAKSTLVRSDADESGIFWQACHDGYSRLKDPVNHHRSIQWQHGQSQLVVIDSFHCLTNHLFEWTWQCGLYWDAVLTGNCVELVKGDLKVTIDLPHDTQVTLLCGGDNPSGGWISKGLGRKVSATRIHVKAIRGTSWSAHTNIHFSKAVNDTAH